MKSKQKPKTKEPKTKGVVSLTRAAADSFVTAHEKELPVAESLAREWYTKKYGERNRNKFIKKLRGRGGIIVGG
jgi:hypothetical protein